MVANDIARGTSMFRETNLWFSSQHCRMLNLAFCQLLCLETHEAHSSANVTIYFWKLISFFLILVPVATTSLSYAVMGMKCVWSIWSLSFKLKLIESVRKNPEQNNIKV